MTSGSTIRRSDQLNYHHHVWSLVESNHVLRIFSPAHTPGLPKLQLCSREDSNLYCRLRRPESYPLNDGSFSHLTVQRYVCHPRRRNHCKSCRNLTLDYSKRGEPCQDLHKIRLISHHLVNVLVCARRLIKMIHRADTVDDSLAV